MPEWMPGGLCSHIQNEYFSLGSISFILRTDPHTNVLASHWCPDLSSVLDSTRKRRSTAGRQRDVYIVRTYTGPWPFPIAKISKPAALQVLSRSAIVGPYGRIQLHRGDSHADTVQT